MENLKFILLTILVLFVLKVTGQDLSKNDIDLKWKDSPNPGRIHVSSVKNKSTVGVRISFINEYGNGTQSKDLRPGEERSVDVTCNLIKAKAINGNNDFIQIFWRKKEDGKKTEVKKEPVETVERTPSQELDKDKDVSNTKDTPVVKRGPLGINDIVPDFINYIETIPLYSSTLIEKENSEISEHITNLKNWTNKKEYIRELRLISYIDQNNDSVTQYKNNVPFLISDYLDKFDGREIKNKKECRDSLQSILLSRIAQRESNILRLSEEVKDTQDEDSVDWKNMDWKIVGTGIGVAIILLILFVWFNKTSKKSRTATLTGTGENVSTDAASAIVVRRKTTSILRKQSLEDVIGNDAYLKIDCSEFCDDSTVRRMYIKNTCIKDIYNMYAEDLRNPNNPNEDGCMVLGRWVHDSENNEYYVSLEHIVLPGDDAVFAEYELNFGGKIKLKVTEKLRKLRRETNLQYDLTCWVHSHPGLGVFFSNSDVNVQMQLKHPTHPNFLTAIVVDILTPQQELGIFTFKHDSTINSKADLKKMYSLEDLYKWAVESDRNSFKPEDYYNSLTNARTHRSDCHGIELSNGAIIDMGMLATEQNSGLVGMVHGFSNQQGQKVENIAVTVTKNEAVPDNELIGCFIIATHCSIPSIRKAVARYLKKIKFVLVYTTTEGLLTSIPIVNNDVCNDESYYGEQKLEDLKIWTRRKR